MRPRLQALLSHLAIQNNRGGLYMMTIFDPGKFLPDISGDHDKLKPWIESIK